MSSNSLCQEIASKKYRLALNSSLIALESEVTKICEKYKIENSTSADIYNIFQENFKSFRDEAISKIGENIAEETAEIDKSFSGKKISVEYDENFPEFDPESNVEKYVRGRMVMDLEKELGKVDPVELDFEQKNCF